jgi:DNA repair exonuclease SbcCD ATPase subunit
MFKKGGATRKSSAATAAKTRKARQQRDKLEKMIKKEIDKIKNLEEKQKPLQQIIDILIDADNIALNHKITDIHKPLDRVYGRLDKKIEKIIDTKAAAENKMKELYHKKHNLENDYKLSSA